MRCWPLAACLQAGIIALAGVGLALWWRPQPHSDWLHYWLAAGDPSLYERGGIGLWLLALPKWLGLPPEAAALAMNVPAALGLCWLAYRADHSRWKWFAQLVFAYLLLLTPYMGIVQLDLVAAAHLGAGFWLLLDQGIRLRPGMRRAIAFAAIVVAVSTRPQYALTLWTLLGMCALAIVVVRRWRTSRTGPILAVLLLASIAGFAADMAMRQVSGRTEQIRTSSAVTLYAGLLVSADTREERCGYWTPEAASAAVQDLDRPLREAVADRLQAQSPAHWVSVMACKMPEIGLPPAYALYWLMSSPNVVERRAIAPDAARVQAIHGYAVSIESRLHQLLVLLILATCAWTVLRTVRKPTLEGLLPTLWILSFWSVHAVFEIQGRYFLGMLLLAPLLCVLVHPRASGPPGSAKTNV